MTTTLDKPRDKINVAEAFRLRYKNMLTYQEIADRFGVTKQAVHSLLSSLTKHLPDPEAIETYRQNKSNILEGAEMVLVQDILDPERRKNASLNNTAYTLTQVSMQNRLEKGLATERIDSFSITASLDDLSRRKQELMDKVMASIQPVVLDTVPSPSIIPGKQDK